MTEGVERAVAEDRIRGAPGARAELTRGDRRERRRQPLAAEDLAGELVPAGLAAAGHVIYAGSPAPEDAPDDARAIQRVARCGDLVGADPERPAGGSRRPQRPHASRAA